jgi:hypothetical protein
MCGSRAGLLCLIIRVVGEFFVLGGLQTILSLRFVFACSFFFHLTATAMSSVKFLITASLLMSAKGPRFVDWVGLNQFSHLHCTMKI